MGSFRRNSLICFALELWRSILTANVLIPRNTSQQSSGPGTAPTAFWRNLRRLPTLVSVAIAAPPIRSLWPPRYLVVLWTEISAPSFNGFWRYGLAKVLSTTNIARFFFAIFEIARMSTTRINGLVGVSIQIILVFFRIAFSTLSGDRGST